MGTVTTKGGNGLPPFVSQQALSEHGRGSGYQLANPAMVQVLFKMDRSGDCQEIATNDLAMSRELNFVGFTEDMFLQVALRVLARICSDP